MTTHDRLRMIARNAVRELSRPALCTRCNQTGRIEAHHEDYAKPYQVTWLCKPCHYVRHKEIEEAKGRKWGQHTGAARERWAALAEQEG